MNMLLIKGLLGQTNAITRYFAQINWTAITDTIVRVVSQLILFTVLFMVINAIGKRVINRGFKTYKAKTRLSTTRVDTIRTLSINAFFYLVMFFYFYAILSSLGVPVGTLLAGAGVVGIALGLGAQGFVNDVITGFFIILEGQFDVGDSVVLGNISGTVIAVGLRTTIVKSPDGTLNYIPNRNITIVSNRSRSQMQVMIDLPVPADVDLDQLRHVLQAVNHELVPKTPTITDEPSLLGINRLPSGIMAYQIMMYVKNGTQADTQRTFLTAYLKALQQAGINIPTTLTTPKQA